MNKLINGKKHNSKNRVLNQSFAVNYNYEVHFTHALFDRNNPIFSQVVHKQAGGPAKVVFVIDERIAISNPSLQEQIYDYFDYYKSMMILCKPLLLVTGGEGIKNDMKFIENVYAQINDNGICRHSYVVAIGGGALLDAVGFAAATAHRGIRHIRVPTTVLSQGDSGVGVKNGINYFGKKNYIGTFSPPYAVLNDLEFLHSLEERDLFSGLAEAVKVSLIKDADLFEYIHENAEKVYNHKDMEVMKNIICSSAELHLKHIGTQGDPFELGSSRPLDFGHWSAHKLEQITNHRLRHGEAVAIGVALDSTYSHLIGLLDEKALKKILKTLSSLGLELFVPELRQKMDDANHPDSIFKGLVEFREHLGGELTLMMLEGIGRGKEIHAVDFDRYGNAINFLANYFDSLKANELHKGIN